MALKKSSLFYYSLTDLPVTMALFPVMVFVPKFYSSDMGIPLLMVANILLAVRVFDLFTDPLLGYISDRSHSRWGRRRPWLVAAVPIMMIGFYQVFLPQGQVGAGYMLGWMLFLSLGTTMMMIPYYAWGAELSSDYHERSLITGWRSIMGVVGSLIAQLVPAAALLFFGFGGSAAVLSIVGVTMLVLMPICVLLTVTQVSETKHSISATIPMRQGLKLMLQNGPFKRLIAAFMVGSIALNITTPLYLFFITFVLHAEEKAIYMLAFFYAANFAGVPFWIWISRFMGKHRAYVASFALMALAHPFYLLLGAGDFWLMLPITLVTGFAAGGFNALPNSMKADVIDIDTLSCGENRAAQFFSAWSFTIKISASIGGWIALSCLAWFNFDASPGAVNGESPLLGLSVLFAVLPSLFYLLAGAIIWHYPITEARHGELRQALEVRKNEVIAEL